jgi:colanic acid/amylovoran/stewartan biosynthesis glycosyltransferase WcaL/AmsK/CpsK
MIKVLHLFEQYLPFTEVWCFNLLKHLPDVEVHVGANNYLKNNFYNSSFHYVDNYFDGLKRENEKLGSIKINNFFQKLFIKIAPEVLGNPLDQFIDYGKKEGIEIIHTHFGKVAWHFRGIPKALGVPFVISFYGWDYEMLPHLHPVYEKRYQQLFKEADCFLCEGSNGAKLLEKKGCPPEKIKIANMGIETEKIPFYNRLKPKQTLKLLQIASFSSKKGYYFTVEAFAQALKICPNMSLCLLGNEREKGLKDKIRKQIQEKGLDHKIQILDSIDYTQLYGFMKDFDVFIHPSNYTEDMDCEGGAPIILLDAQATGLPVISTRHCDIPEEVIHEKTGVLVKEKDIDGLSKTIELFYNMDDLKYKEFSLNARNHVLENYNLKKTSARVKAIYDEILNAR